MIEITAPIHIDLDGLSEQFCRSPGPGGQNLNKVETAVQLRFGETIDQKALIIIPAARRRSVVGWIKRSGSTSHADWWNRFACSTLQPES